MKDCVEFLLHDLIGKYKAKLTESTEVLIVAHDYSNCYVLGKIFYKPAATQMFLKRHIYLFIYLFKRLLQISPPDWG